MVKLLILCGFLTCIVIIIVLINCIIVASHLGEITTINTELGAQYECGFIPFSDSRLQFEIQFYLISLLFIVFDVEIALILPYSLVTLEVGFHGFYLIAGFFIILGLGFILEWESGILNLVKVR